MAFGETFRAMAEGNPSTIYKLGIFGGTFDPIHMGHLAAAERVREQAALDAVMFMPAGVPVFKLDRDVSKGEDRLAMCELATKDNPNFDVSDIEVKRTGNTYTYETLRALRAYYPANVELYFIAGADAIITLGKWRNAAELTQLAHFIAMTRPGYSEDEAKRSVYVNGERLDVTFLEVPGLDISSSYLRACVKDDRTIRYLVPESVRKYIMEHGLYR